MSAVVLILLGLFLCFAGARSLRLAVVVAGFGAAWLLSDALGADLLTSLLVAAGGAAGALALSVMLARFLLFGVGLVMGAAIGARLFELLDRGESSWLLATIFVPAVALVAALLAERLHRSFMVWVTAFAGAALALGGVGRIGTDPTEALRRPESTLVALIVAGLWVALGLAGRAAQAEHLRD